MSDKRVHLKGLEHFVMTHSLCLLQSQSSPSNTVFIIFTVIQIQSVFVGLPPSIPVHHHNLLSHSLEFVATMTSGYHNSLVPFLVYEIHSQNHIYSTNINHSHRCTNEAMFTAVKDALTNKPTVEMEWDVLVCMHAIKL